MSSILKFETSTSLHSVFIHNLYNVPTFLESGLYFCHNFKLNRTFILMGCGGPVRFRVYLTMVFLSEQLW